MSKTLKKVLSVSVAAYNIEQYLAETIDSCLAIPDEYLKKLEVIIVNDGSSDGTLAIAKNYEEKTPNVVRVVDKPNGGHGSTINAALAVAQGKYFRYLDGDDWFERDGLIACLDNLSKTDADVYYSPFIQFYENDGTSELINSLEGVAPGIQPIDALVKGGIAAAHSLTYKTSLLRKLHFSLTENCFYVDTEYAFIPLAFAENIYVQFEPLYRYRLGRAGQSMSKEVREKRWRDVVTVCTRIYREIAQSAIEQGPNSYIWKCLIEVLLNPYLSVTAISPNKERYNALKSYIKETTKKSLIKEEICERLPLAKLCIWLPISYWLISEYRSRK